MKRVAVIGAGFSGLASAKACLEEGLEPVCFERSDQCGGVWVTRDEKLPGQDATNLMYDCLITNSSKEMMCFSDFPFDAALPPYLRWKDVVDYCRKYAQHFAVDKCIRYNTTVLQAEKTEDFDETGQWRITSQTRGSDPVTEVYDALMVCSGLHTERFIPDVPGMSEFKGQILHSSDFKNGTPFAGKTVIAVGASHSAGDVAVDCSRHTKMTYLSTRSGVVVIPRQAPGGIPLDSYLNQRWRGRTLMPLPLWRKVMQRFLRDRMDVQSLGLESERPLFTTTSVMVNDEIGVRIWCGAMQAKPNIERFTETGVVFVDGTVIEHVDAVIFATGYYFRFPFIDRSILKESYADLELYLHIFSPHLARQTFAAIGLVNAVGANGPVFELQARMAVRVFKGLISLPGPRDMLEDVARRRNFAYRLFGKHKIVFPPTPYSDQIAGKIGCLPDTWELVKTDPALAFRFYFGPNYPYFYRLVGPHAWARARDAIFSAPRNTTAPTQTRLAKKAVAAGAMTHQPDFLKFTMAVLFVFILLCVL